MRIGHQGHEAPYSLRTGQPQHPVKSGGSFSIFDPYSPSITRLRDLFLPCFEGPSILKHPHQVADNAEDKVSKRELIQAVRFSASAFPASSEGPPDSAEVRSGLQRDKWATSPIHCSSL